MNWEALGWSWWGVMVAVSIVNVVVLSCHRRARTDVAAWIFTLVCAYRAVLPRVDVPRLCFIPGPLSWTIWGRVAATIAELAWAFQMGRYLAQLGSSLHSSGLATERASARARAAGFTVVALAATAECCSWTNLITKDNLFAVFEQSLWAVLFFITGAGSLALLPKWSGRPRGTGHRLVAVVLIVTGLEQGFEAFGLYLTRYLADERAGVVYDAFWHGFKVLWTCAEVSQDFRDWVADASWMTTYFSIGVWSSIWLASPVMPEHAARAGLTAQA